jgi:hypothetical protein
MSTPTVPVLSARDLVEVGRQAASAPPCDRCGPLSHPGWESMPASFERDLLRRIGTLRRDDPGEEPTLREHHPRGTHAWSADAPIVPGYFPYNRCDVWQCKACARAYLRYTEYGGYYEDERVRALDPALVDDTPA